LQGWVSFTLQLTLGTLETRHLGETIIIETPAGERIQTLGMKGNQV